MLELKDYQKKAVKQLKENIMDMLSLSGDRQKIVFKAPTGAGKTVMASDLLDKLNQELQMQYNEVAFIWIAPNKLHIQSYMSFRNFFSETRTLRPVMFDDVDSSAGLNPGEVLFLNWESINKENAVMIRDNEQNRTLFRLTRKTQQNGYPIIVVIDEEHMFAGRNAKKSEMVLQNINPKIELRISATPTTGGCPLVEVAREHVINEGMIKKGIQLNPHVKASQDTNLTMNQQLIEIALKKREALAKQYYEYGINPLLLIQLPNDNTDSLSVDEKKVAEEVKQYLNVYKDITTDNGKLAIWLSGTKENVNGIEAKESMVEVLLFKQAIALGWDCPRAAVLLIFRDLKSPTFTTQTVGRILRMPEQHHYANDALNYGYVYTNLSVDMIEIVKDDISYISTIYAKRRDNISENVQLPSVFQERRKTPHVLKSPFKKIFKDAVSELWNLPQNTFGDADDGWDTLSNNTNADEYNATENRRKANAHGIRTDVQKIMIAIPKDLEFKGTESHVMVEDKARFARTQNELIAAFNLFCRKNVGDYEPGQSAEMIRSAIYELFLEYLAINEFDAIKVVLSHLNQPKFEQYIAKARDRYTELYYKKEEEARNAEEYKLYVWRLPETRMYNVEQSDTCNEVYRHAMIPYFEEKKASGPERIFSRWLDKQTETIDWWYKNGDKGNMHFAVPYNDKEGTPRCFYVDYIIHLKNGVTCLFDTKTKDSDADAPYKHNALLDYMKHENDTNHRNLVGGVTIQEGGNWFYSTMKIENTKDLAGWNVIDFVELNK